MTPILLQTSNKQFLVHLSLLTWFEGRNQAVIKDHFTATSCLCPFLRVRFTVLWRELIRQADWSNSCSSSPHSQSSLPHVPVLHMRHSMALSPCIRLFRCILTGHWVRNPVREFGCCSGDPGSNPTQTKFIFSLQRQPFWYRSCRHRRLWSLFLLDETTKPFSLIIETFKKIYEAVATPRPLSTHFLYDAIESC